MVSLPIILLGSVFLLLPLAHERLIGAFPLYLSEAPLLLAGCLLMFRHSFLNQIKTLIQQEKWFWLAQGMMVGGSFLVLIFSGSLLTRLGLLKSFIIFPILFTLLLSLFVRAQEHQRLVIYLWWLGIVAAALASLWLYLDGTLTYDGRLASLYASPNYLAMLLAPGVLISWWLLDEDCSWGRTFVLVGAAVLIIALIFTRSYAVILATLVLSIPFLTPLIRKPFVHWKKFFVMLLGIVLISWWGSIEISTEKFHALFDFAGRSSVASRLMIWEAAIKISHDTWPWGIGLGRFQEVYLAYQPYFPPYLEWAVPEPHNLFLSIFLSTSFLGFAGFLTGSIIVGSRLLQAFNQPEVYTKKTAKLLMSLMGWFWLVGIVDTPFFRNDLAFVWWGVLGLSLALTSRQETRS